MEFRVRVLAMAITVSAIVTSLTVCAPYLVPYGTFTGLGGVAGFIEGGWEGYGFASAIYAVGDVCCHQLDSRSFFLNGSQMPVCMRDFGFLIGLVIGFFLCVLIRHSLTDHRVAYVGALFLVIMAAEWLIETTGIDLPTARFTSGIIAGIGAAMIGGWLLYREQVE